MSSSIFLCATLIGEIRSSPCFQSSLKIMGYTFHLLKGRPFRWYFLKILLTCRITSYALKLPECLGFRTRFRFSLAHECWSRGRGDGNSFHGDRIWNYHSRDFTKTIFSLCHIGNIFNICHDLRNYQHLGTSSCVIDFGWGQSVCAELSPKSAEETTAQSSPKFGQKTV